MIVVVCSSVSVSGPQRTMIADRLSPSGPPRFSPSRIICGAVVRIGVDVSHVATSRWSNTLHRPSVQMTRMSPLRSGVRLDRSITGSTSPPRQLKILLRSGCDITSSAPMMPWSTRYCTFEWSLVEPMSPPCRNRYRRESPTWHQYAWPACTMHATHVVRGVSSIENWFA